MKSEILERLGQTDALLPTLITDGLAANDRVKVRLSVVQAAAAHALDPAAARVDLAPEYQQSDLDPGELDALVEGARIAEGGRIAAPGLGALAAAIFDDVGIMTKAVSTGEPAEGERMVSRLAALRLAAASFGQDDAAAPAEVDQLIRLAGGEGDSLHRLVVDLHRALNQLAVDHSEEVLAGAHVYGLSVEDHPLVEAFMRGVELTRALKFDHPGLDTLAVRSGARLTIQNDIGETNAHVLVIAAEQDAVTVTYTDVHRERARFFVDLLADFPVAWTGLDRGAETLGQGTTFYLISGRLAVSAKGDAAAYLEAVGAIVVFLIDWNKARKVLQTWTPKGDAVRILSWAARHRFGHRAFLELGGAELVRTAIRDTASARIGFGDRLDHVIGREGAVEFLRSVLRISSETLLAGFSVRQARDRIEVDLMQRLQREDAALLAVVVRQAGLAREIAADIARFVADRRAERPGDGKAVAARARRIEEKADKMAAAARAEIARLGADQSVEVLVDRMEDTIDELEQAAFVTSVVPAGVNPDLLKALAILCATTVSGAEAAAAGSVAAACVPEGQRVDSDDVLKAIDRLLDAEHSADAAERDITAIVLGRETDFRVALSVLEMARALERATDKLAAFGHRLRDHVVAELSG